MEGNLTCGKCKTPLEIDAAHVTFRGGKKAYIKCPNPKCNNQRRISFAAVKHLKPNDEAVKAENNTNLEKQDEGGQAFDAPAKTAVPEAIKQALSEETNASDPKKDNDSGAAWGIIGLAGLFGLGALIAWARR